MAVKCGRIALTLEVKAVFVTKLEAKAAVVIVEAVALAKYAVVVAE